MITLTGIRRSTYGQASQNLATTQLPLIAQEFPEVAACPRGTINLRLDRALVVACPDYRTSRIDWHRLTRRARSLTCSESDWKHRKV